MESRFRPRPHSLRPRATAFVCLLVGVLLAAAGCKTAAPAPPPEPAEPAAPPAAERPYLVDPLEGWTGPVSTAEANLLAEGYEAVLAADPEAVREAVRQIVGDRSPTAYPPAAVLAAEADLLDRRPAAAVSLLDPLDEEHPDYPALQVVLGRAAEATGDLVTAFAAFRRAAEEASGAERGVGLLAFDRTRELGPRVEEILSNRIADALARGAVDDAARPLSRLRDWLPESEVTWRSALAVAEARGDRPAELEAVRELGGRFPEERPLQERRAELELEVGEVDAGLQVYQDLVERYPGEPGLEERLDYAKFRWRVQQMPPRVQRAAAQSEMQRGDLAVLLYWLVPRVRSARTGEARIASDILDDPRREEIARILNLGLMERDPSVHRFYPDRPVRRSTALLATLRILARFGNVPCAAPAAGEARPGPEELCALALDCGLVRGEEGCTPSETLSGAEVVDLLRRALTRMAGGGAGAGGEE